VALRIADPVLAERLEGALDGQAGLRLLATGAPDEDDQPEVVIADEGGAADPDAALLRLVEGRGDALAALAGGAQGVLSAAADTDDLVAAVTALAGGLAVLEPGLLDDLLDRRSGLRAASDGAAPSLTRREAEVLALLAEGASNKVIARRLGISFHTVKFHVASLIAKLEATGRTDAVAQALRRGLLML